MQSKASANYNRTSAVFRKNKPDASKLPSGTEVFAQATTVKDPLVIKPGKPKSSEPKLLLASTQPSVPDSSFNFPSMVGSNLLVRTTAYCHKETDSLPYGRLNAAGGTLQYGATVRSAAADWSRFPLGTKFRIEGQPYEYVIDDYGSALVGTNTIDLYKPTFTAMNEWGARRVPIRIIEWGCFNKSREILDGRKHVKHADHVRQMLQDIESRYVPKHRTAGLPRDWDSKVRA
jgi:3D (Asp-Asp-Asp) domain-containing protein